MLFKGHAIAEVNFYEAMGSEKPVHIDILCVHSDHQRKGIGTALLRSCITRASRVASACVGEFTSCAGQLIGAFQFTFSRLTDIIHVTLRAMWKRFALYSEEIGVRRTLWIAVRVLRGGWQQIPSFRNLSAGELFHSLYGFAGVTATVPNTNRTGTSGHEKVTERGETCQKEKAGEKIGIRHLFY